MGKERISVSMTVAQAADAWLARYSSTNTRLAYGSDLRAFLGWFGSDSDALRAGSSELARYRQAREASGASRSTIDRQFAALRAFYAAARELGVCTESPFGERLASVTARSVTHVLTVEESRQLRSASTVDPRAAVLVHLLLDEGMRLSEVLGLDHGHISGTVAAKRLSVRRHGRLIEVVVDRAASRSIHRVHRRGSPDGPLLEGPSRGGRRIRLSRFGADHLLKQAAGAGGIESAVSANVLRRSHVANAQRAGVHLEEIRQQMGHRDVRTTRRYLVSDSNQAKS